MSTTINHDNITGLYPAEYISVGSDSTIFHVKSSNIKVFPSSWRGAELTVTNTGILPSTSITQFNPESTLNTEYNITRTAGAIKNYLDYAATKLIDGITVYDFKFFINGYAFEINNLDVRRFCYDESLDTSALNLYAYLRVGDMSIASSSLDYTRVLMPFNWTAIDTPIPLDASLNVAYLIDRVETTSITDLPTGGVSWTEVLPAYADDKNTLLNNCYIFTGLVLTTTPLDITELTNANSDTRSNYYGVQLIKNNEICRDLHWPSDITAGDTPSGLSTKIGYNLKADVEHMLAIGQYNETTPADSGNPEAEVTVFAVGNGVNEDNRKNAFEITSYISENELVEYQDQASTYTNKFSQTVKAGPLEIKYDSDLASKNLDAEITGVYQINNGIEIAKDGSHIIINKPFINSSNEQQVVSNAAVGLRTYGNIKLVGDGTAIHFVDWGEYEEGQMTGDDSSRIVSTLRVVNAPDDTNGVIREGARGLQISNVNNINQDALIFRAPNLVENKGKLKTINTDIFVDNLAGYDHSIQIGTAQQRGALTVGPIKLYSDNDNSKGLDFGNGDVSIIKNAGQTKIALGSTASGNPYFYKTTNDAGVKNIKTLNNLTLIDTDGRTAVYNSAGIFSTAAPTQARASADPQASIILDYANNKIRLTGNIEISGNTTITGTTTIQDAVQITGDTTIAGTTTLNSKVTMEQDADIKGKTKIADIELNADKEGSAADSESLLGSFLRKVYPIGSIYLSADGRNPNELLGFGTWTQISQGRVLLGAGKNGDVTFDNTQTGGSYTTKLVKHTHPFSIAEQSLTTSEIVAGGTVKGGAHTHTINFKTQDDGTHNHNIPVSQVYSNWLEPGYNHPDNFGAYFPDGHHNKPNGSGTPNDDPYGWYTKEVRTTWSARHYMDKPLESSVLDLTAATHGSSHDSMGNIFRDKGRLMIPAVAMGTWYTPRRYTKNEPAFGNLNSADLQSTADFDKFWNKPGQVRTGYQVVKMMARNADGTIKNISTNFTNTTPGSRPMTGNPEWITCNSYAEWENACQDAWKKFITYKVKVGNKTFDLFSWSSYDTNGSYATDYGDEIANDHYKINSELAAQEGWSWERIYYLIAHRFASGHTAWQFWQSKDKTKKPEYEPVMCNIKIAFVRDWFQRNARVGNDGRSPGYMYSAFKFRVDDGNHQHAVKGETVSTTPSNYTFTGTKHKHTITVNAVSSNTSESGTISPTNTDNLPPYLVCYIWQRTE